MGKALLKNKGLIFIVSAPSGAGKTTLCMKIIRKMNNLVQSVSFTTRQPRPGEIHDKDYSFITRKEFRMMVDEGDFVEWAEVHGNLYGTSRRRLNDILASGFDVLLDIDTQGAKQIRNLFKNGVFIFILPPTMKELRNRLEKRMSNTHDDIDRRLKRAVNEIRDYKIYDYVIVNDVIKNAMGKIEAIIIAERIKNSNADLTGSGKFY